MHKFNHGNYEDIIYQSFLLGTCIVQFLRNITFYDDNAHTRI